MAKASSIPAWTSETARWKALVQRDPRADDQFYYSVRTTGVYCRPSCAARLPRRENVQFHATCEEAERSGFRPCKRCRPDQASLPVRQQAVITAACRQIEASDDARIDLNTLAAAAGMSKFHFHKVFKAIVGLTPTAYAAAHRAKRMSTELVHADTSITEAIYQAGYQASSRFYESSGKNLGMTPTTFRAGGKGESIRFAVAKCQLGFALVAATDMGICAISLGEDPDDLRTELQSRFPKANWIASDPIFERIVARAVKVIDGLNPALPLPLDIRGTAFQRRVWMALCKIPQGTTTTYSDLAHKLGVPKSTRAVAGAIAANNLAVAIPCHRVVRADGSMAGYRWGVQRKRALLAREHE